MKLNKKGFGVAEIAIVILLIGILAAAVIAGFMGIKKNANDVAEEQKEIAQTMSNDLKHSFPTILSGDEERLEIGAGEYEVYELGGYSIKGGTAPGGTTKTAIVNRGTLYVSGNGTLDKTTAINANGDTHKDFINGRYAVYNYGEIHLSDIVLIGGGLYSGSNKVYAFYCESGSKATLDNVYFHTTNGGFAVGPGAELIIKGQNTVVTNTTAGYKNAAGNKDYEGRTSSYLFFTSGGTIKIYDGSYLIERQHNTYVYNSGGEVTIYNGTFKGAQLYNGFILAAATLNIEDGFFECDHLKNDKKYAFFNLSSSAVVNIKNGEFVEIPGQLAMGSGSITITGGAFQWNPDAYVDDESGAYTITKTSGYLCRDGQTRTMYVVTKN